MIHNTFSKCKKLCCTLIWFDCKRKKKAEIDLVIDVSKFISEELSVASKARLTRFSQEINRQYYRKCLIKDSIVTFYGNFLLKQSIYERVTGVLGLLVLGQRKAFY